VLASGAFPWHPLSENGRNLCDEGRLVTFPEASHWVLHDEAERVSQLLIEHFSKAI
jgi:pimeloyl-ACP methyl ester carboxylesterase